MLSVLAEPSATVVATAAFTGLRLGELRGLTWESYEPVQDEDSVLGQFQTDPVPTLVIAKASLWALSRVGPISDAPEKKAGVVCFVGRVVRSLQSGLSIGNREKWA